MVVLFQTIIGQEASAQTTAAQKGNAKQPSAGGNPFTLVVGQILGLQIIETESKGIYSQQQIEKIKKAYSDVADNLLSMLKEAGLDKPKGDAWTKEEVLSVWGEISSFIWSNFTYAPTALMSDGFNEFAEGKQVWNRHLDCDTSAFFAADILQALGLNCWICDVSSEYMASNEGHSILKVGAPDSQIWLETTYSGKTDSYDFYLSYYTSLDAVKDRYPKYSEQSLSSEMPILYYNRSKVNEGLGNYRGAIADYTKLIELDPTSGDLYIDRASCKNMIRDIPGAIADYQKACELLNNPPYLQKLIKALQEGIE